MADEQKTQTQDTAPDQTERMGQDNQATGAQAEEEIRKRAKDATESYDRARREMMEAVQSLRAEIARIDLQQAGRRARTWVDENPALAAALGAGAGILVGKMLSGALKPAPPPPLRERALRRAGAFTGELGEFTAGVGAALAAQAALAAKAAQDATEGVSKRAQALGEGVNQRAEHLVDAASDAAHQSAKALSHTSRDVEKAFRKRGKKVRKQVDRGIDFSESVVNAARTAVAAVVIKKVNDWIKAVK